MKTNFETKGEYEGAIATALGYDNGMPSEYWDVISTLTLKILAVILAMIEEAASSVSSIVDIDGENVAKLQHIEEAARRSHGKLAKTILAIIESDIFVDPGNFLEDDPDNFLEDDDAPD